MQNNNRKSWLDQLPQFLKQIEAEFNIKIKQPFKNPVFNYAAEAIQADGTECVFKCAIPNDEFLSELNALKYFNGQGAVKLISSDLKSGWMLLEKCTPGISIEKLDENKAAEIFATLIKSLLKPIDQNNQNFKHIKNWLDKLDLALVLKPEFNISKKLIQNAVAIKNELLSSLGESVLLHGDLHHHNILSNKNNYLAIDPKGIIGEREYEIGAFMRNPYTLMKSDINLKKLFNRRLFIITELTHFDRDRLIKWTFVQAVLAAIWHSEDKTEGVDWMIEVAENAEILIKHKSFPG